MTTSNEGGQAGSDPGKARRKGGRGFAGMDPDQQREIARLGGRAAHRKGVAHEFTSQEARAAGRIGGQNSHIRKRALREQGMAAGVRSDTAQERAAPAPGSANSPSAQEESQPRRPE